MVDYNGLENRRTERYRGFESLSLRNLPKWKSLILNGLAAFFVYVPQLSDFFGEHLGNILGDILGTVCEHFQVHLNPIW